MPAQEVEAELKRRNAALALVDWLLIADVEQLITGLSDPVIDQGTRDRLDLLLAALTATLDVAGTVAVSNFPATQPVSGTVEVTNDVGNPLPVSGTVTATGPLTDAQLRAAVVPVSLAATTVTNEVEVKNDAGSPLAVSGTVTATGPLTDTQLRATPVPVSGTVTVTDGSGPITVDGTITQRPIVESTSNATTTVLAAGATFTGAYENILQYQQLGVSVFARPNIILSGDASDAKGSLFIDFDDNGTGTASVQIPYVVRSPGLFVPQVLITVRPFFRLRYINDGGAAAITALGLVETAGTPTLQTEFVVKTLLFPQATKELGRTLDQGLSGSDPATLVRSVNEGRSPDGVYRDAGVGGTKTLSPATSLLGISASYTSDWFDTERFPSVRLLVTSDVVSAANGIVLQWSDTPTGVAIRTSETHTFRNGHITNGRLILAATRARYLRVLYVNGGSVQTRFFLNLRLSIVPITENVNVISSASGTTGQQDVTVAAVALNGGIALSGRDSIRLTNLSTSARPLFYGFNASLTVVSGDELAVGASVDMDIDEFVQVFVICSSVAGGGVRCAYTEIA